jgi:hypothetical protein
MVVLCLACGWWATGLQPFSPHATLSSLANDALDARPVRAVAVATWLLACGWLGRR